MAKTRRTLARIGRLGGRRRLALLALPGLAGLLVAGCTPVGYDPLLLHRCIVGETWSYTPDCSNPAAGHWTVGNQGGTGPELSLYDASNGQDINGVSPLDMTLAPPGSYAAVKGWTVGMFLDPGIKPSNAASTWGSPEVDLVLQDLYIERPLAGLNAFHTIEMRDHSGYFDVEYGIKFENPANHEWYILNYVLSPQNPYPASSSECVQWRGSGGKSPVWNVIKLNARCWGAPRIDYGWSSLNINWEALLNYVHSRGWWTGVSSSVIVQGEWFQEQGWAYQSPTAGGVGTIQGNWSDYYP